MAMRMGANMLKHARVIRSDMRKLLALHKEVHPGGGIKCAQAKWAIDSEIVVIGVKEEEIIDSCFRDEPLVIDR